MKDGAFEIDAIIPAPGAYSLRVSALHANGAGTTKRFNFSAHAKDVLVDADKLNHYSDADDPQVIAQFINPRSQATAAAFLLENEKSPEEQAKLKGLTESIAAKPLPELDPAMVADPTLWLSDAKWTNASVGWGIPARNMMGAPSEITGPFIRLGNAYFVKGIYAHSPSSYSFQLAKKWTSFTAVVGVKSGDAPQRNAIFVVKGDGRELYRSKLLNSLKQENVKVDVTDVATLELIVEKGTGPNGHAWAVWGSPQVSR